jgi:hypothetical protein
MIGPPTVSGPIQEAHGASTRSKDAARILSPYVRFVNPVWNSSKRYIKRKKADHYVKEKRGVLVGPAADQLCSRCHTLRTSPRQNQPPKRIQ